MDAVTVRTRAVSRRSELLCLAAADLQQEARSTREMVASHVLRSATRRLSRLARGSSEGPVKETADRHCPCCRSESIKSVGRVCAAEGLIKSTYRCEACNSLFLIVRRSTELGRETRAS